MSHFKQRFQLLLIPDFRWYVLSCFMAMFGVGLGYVAMTWLVLAGGRSVGSVATLMIGFWLSSILLGPIVGVVVDRYPRQWIMLGTNLIRGLFLIVFGLYFFHHFAVNDLYVLSIIMGALLSFYIPAAMKLVREIVPPEKLLYANSILDMAYEAGNIIGVGVAGLLVAKFSGPTVIVMNGLCFMFSVIALLMISPKNLRQVDQPQKASKHFFREFYEGFKYLFNKPGLILVYSIQLLIMVEAIITPVLLAPFAKYILKINVDHFGHIEASMSAGIIIGGIFIPWIAEKFGFLKSLFVTTFILAVSFFWFSQNHSYTFAEILYFIIGLCLAVWPLIITKAQEKTDMAYQGRVHATFNILSSLIVLAIYMTLKFAGQYVPLRDLYLIEVLLTILAMFMLWRFRKLEWNTKERTF